MKNYEQIKKFKSIISELDNNILFEAEEYMKADSDLITENLAAYRNNKLIEVLTDLTLSESDLLKPIENLIKNEIDFRIDEQVKQAEAEFYKAVDSEIQEIISKMIHDLALKIVKPKYSSMYEFESESDILKELLGVEILEPVIETVTESASQEEQDYIAALKQVGADININQPLALIKRDVHDSNDFLLEQKINSVLAVKAAQKMLMEELEDLKQDEIIKEAKNKHDLFEAVVLERDRVNKDLLTKYAPLHDTLKSFDLQSIDEYIANIAEANYILNEEQEMTDIALNFPIDESSEIKSFITSYTKSKMLDAVLDKNIALNFVEVFMDTSELEEIEANEISDLTESEQQIIELTDLTEFVLFDGKYFMIRPKSGQNKKRKNK